MDSEYQLRRRMNQRRNKPRHAMYVPSNYSLAFHLSSPDSYGVAAGAEALATSVASGMEGIVVGVIWEAFEVASDH